MPVPHHSVFTGRIPFLSPNPQRQSTERNSQHEKSGINDVHGDCPSHSSLIAAKQCSAST